MQEQPIHPRVCPKCGGRKSYYSVVCRACKSPERPWFRGDKHPAWKGDDVKNPGLTGRKRARTRFKIGPCEECGDPGYDRHHKDGNTLNNEPSNIAILCRRCHMRVDGRLEILTTVYAGGPKTDPKPCVECGRLYKPLRTGLCSRCYDRRRRPAGSRAQRGA